MILKIFTVCIFIFSLSSIANTNENNFYDIGKKLFDEEKYEESKFQLERSIVYNPKHSNSYLYLGKIFKIEKNTKEKEKNINTALLLDPKNEEAMYILIDLELERSNFSRVQDLKEDFKKICNTLCEKLTSIDTRLKDFEKKDAS